MAEIRIADYDQWNRRHRDIRAQGLHRGPLRSAKQEYQPPYQEALSHREQGEHVLLNTRTKNRN